MTTQELHAEMIRLSGLIDDAIVAMVDTSKRWAVAEDNYRMVRATHYLETTGTVMDRQSRVDLLTSEERKYAHEMDALRRAAIEAVRARRAQLSALQTIAGAHRAEAEFVRTGPQ